MTTFRKPRQEQKLTIKGFSDIPKLPPDYAQSSWTQLESNLKELISFKRMSLGRESMYQTVTTLCNNENGPFILSKLIGFLQEYICQEMQLLQSSEVDLHNFTEKFDSHWENFQINLQNILSIFMFLDGDLRNKREIGILDKANTLYKETLLKYSGLNQRLLSALMDLIYEERAYEHENKLILQRLILMLAKLGMYHSHFFPLFIQETNKYYLSVSNLWFDSSNISDYLHQVEKALKKEHERIVNYLGSFSTEESITCVEKIMVKDMCVNILEKGMEELIQGNKVNDLSLLYKLVKKVGEIELLDKCFCMVVKKNGNSIVGNTCEEVNLVTLLLDLQDKIENIMVVAFENNMKIKYSNKVVWESFLNTGSKIAVELAKDFDDNLKKGGKAKLTESELDKRFTGMINIFKLLNCKDVFEAIHFNRLAKRLLLDKSKSNDLEKSITSKLKTECGTVFILRFRNIQNDIGFSNSFNENFREKFTTPFDFKCWVLTENGWPKSTLLKPNLPPEFFQIQESFNNHYKESMKKRYLIWNSGMSYCELQCSLPHGNKSLTVSFHQALILLLFNRSDSYTVSEISSLTAIPIETVKSELLQICKKCRILSTNFSKNDINDSGILTFNSNFKHKYYKITINTFQLKETLVETNNTIEKVLSERLYAVDAVIVRVMKTRRIMEYKDLTRECISALGFSVSVNDFKKRIETLIEREFIRRDLDNMTIIHYIT